MDVFQFVVLSLAAFRITRLLVFDTIAKFIRNPFIEEFELTEESGKQQTYIRIKGKGIQKFFGELLSCYWCTGVWVATGVVLLHYFVPESFLFFTIFAVAGIAAVIEVFVNKWVS